MIIDGVTWLFQSVTNVLSTILVWDIPFSDDLTVNLGTLVLFFFVLMYIPKFINLIFGSKKGILKNGRE